MYIDLLILLVLLILVVMFFKRFSSFVFFMAIVEIFLRILSFVRDNIGLDDISQVIGKYLPSNIFAIIDKYTGNVLWLNTILKWCFVGIMTAFLVYTVQIFWKKKKL